jgi:hypothetical protein
VVTVCVTLLFSTVRVRAQTDDVLPSGNNGGMDALYAEHKKHRDLAKDLISGIRVAIPQDTSHVEALDAQAKYVTYPFTWPTIRSKPEAIAKTFGGGVELDVKTLLKGGRGSQTAAGIYAAKVTEHAVEVLKNRTLIARVNAARVLAEIAKLGPPELSDALVAVIEDQEQFDAVKYYAFRGLKILGELQPPVMSAEREKKAAEALAAFIDRKMSYATDTTTREEVEGFRVIRREAIRALAQIHNPAAAANGQGAFMLLRVVAKDGLVPRPRIDERVEAAIGLARLKSSLDKQYNLDYAAAQIGLFLDDFNREDLAAKQRREDTRGPLILPWKGMSLRMYEAIEQMRTDAGSDNPYAVKVTTECLKLLERLEKDNAADPEEILQAVKAQPPSNRLFKNIEDSTVRPANRSDTLAEGPQLPARMEGRRVPPPGAPGGPPEAKPDAKPGAAPEPAKPATGAPQPAAKPGAPPAAAPAAAGKP